MPNTPALVLAGASVLYCNSLVNREERENVKRIFESIGATYVIQDEDLLDAVTGLSGSGPAFVAMFIEALSDGGVSMGLSRDMALRLAAQTVYGTAKMVLEGGIHPSELKDKVSSPAGTTIEGIKELEFRGFRGSVISAVSAATRRSKELSKGGK
jgi:pyrroline-5-carboxylate reductase